MVRFVRLLTACSVLAIASASPVAYTAPPKKADGGEEEVSEKEIAKSVELIGLVFPVFDDGYRLKNYLFVNARLVVADGKDTWKFREQAHMVRDAVLREAHRSSLHYGDDYGKLDIERATKECLKAGNLAVGEDAFVSVAFTQIDSQGG